MKPHHAAALALVGWYLIAPPMPVDPQGNARILRNAPLKDWILVRSFDSALACQRFLAPMVAEDANRGAGEMRENLRKGEKVNLDDYDTPMMLAHCIASDDPRLKEK